MCDCIDVTSQEGCDVNTAVCRLTKSVVQWKVWVQLQLNR